MNRAGAISARVAARCSFCFHLLSAANRKCSGSGATNILKGIHVLNGGRRGDEKRCFSTKCSAGNQTRGDKISQESRAPALAMPDTPCPFSKIATFFLQIKNGKKGPFLRK